MAEADRSTTLEAITRSGIEWINNWENNIQIHRIRGHVYALNTSQSVYTGRNTSHKQDIRVCNRTEVVTFLRQNLSRIFTVSSTVINNGSQIKFRGKDIDLIKDKTGRYFTNLSIARLHLMDMGLGKSGTAVMQDKYGGLIEQNWINNQEIFFVAQSVRAEFGGSKVKEISSIKDDDDKNGLTTSVIFYSSLRIGIIKLSKFRIPVSKTLALIGKPVTQNITIIDLQEQILSHFGINGVSISNIFDDEGLCFHPSSSDITISERI